MAAGYQETKGMVITFLEELKRILNDKNSVLRLYPREDKDFEYTTKYCLQFLGFNENDVRNELKKLTIDSYVETCDDERNPKTHKYYVFYKIINQYILKLKLKVMIIRLFYVCHFILQNMK